MLFVFGFLFLHSELDFFSPDEHSHISHDFCDIVDNAKTENPDLSKINTCFYDMSAVFFSMPFDLTVNINILKPYTNCKPGTDVDLNILHGAFLI